MLTRFPVLTAFGYVLRCAAILCLVVGLVLLDRVGISGLIVSILAGLVIWVYAEITGVALAIEANTFATKQSLERLARLMERNETTNAAPRHPELPTYLAPPIRAAANAINNIRKGMSKPSDPSTALTEKSADSAENSIQFPEPALHKPGISIEDAARGEVDAWDPVELRRVGESIQLLVDSAIVSEVPAESSLQQSATAIEVIPSILSGLPEIPILGGSQSSNSTRAALAYDRDPRTFWASTGSVAPESAFVSFDLGSMQSIRGIAWSFVGLRDRSKLRVQISADHYGWETIATRPGVSDDEDRFLRCTNTRARYVRLLFENPKRLATVGHLRDVRIFSAI